MDPNNSVINKEVVVYLKMLSATVVNGALKINYFSKQYLDPFHV